MPLIRTAVIGAGRWGCNLIRNVAESNFLKLVAICDLQWESLARFPGIPKFFDAATLLDESACDAVVIATPPQTHTKLVELALAAGKHVLCEKPLALNAEGCLQLAELANAAGVCLMVDCTPVYLDEIERARTELPWEQVTSISCHRISPRRSDHCTDALWDLAPHDLAVMDSWLGGLPLDWKCRPIAAGMHFQSRDAHQISLEVSVGYAQITVREITVTTSRASHVFDQSQRKPEPLQTVMTRFATSIRDRTEPMTNAFQAARIASVLEGVAYATADPR